MRPTIRLVVLTVFLCSSLAGCFSTTTIGFREGPAPIGDNVSAIILYDGERIPLGNTDVEQSDRELVVRDRSGMEVRRIPIDEIQEVAIVDFNTGRTVLLGLGVLFGSAVLMGDFDSAPE